MLKPRPSLAIPFELVLLEERFETDFADRTTPFLGRAIGRLVATRDI
ncbi:unnamed protein product, partial [Rotaria magnacalcarata]